MRRIHGVFLAASLVAAGALADTVTVPTDHATIQAAIDDVQGTAGALVWIDSDDTFNEDLTIVDSVAIRAAAGRQPTIRGVGDNTVDVELAGTGGESFELTGLRLLPFPGANSSVDVVNVIKDGDQPITVFLDRLTVEDPESSGAGAVNLRSAFAATGALNATIVDSAITLGGTPGQGTSAITMLEEGSLTVERCSFDISESSGEAWDIRGSRGAGIVFELFDSTVDISSPAGPFSSQVGIFLNDVSATLERNVFTLIDEAEGSADGIRTSPGSPGPGNITIQMRANTFRRVGQPGGRALSASPFAGGQVQLVAINNVIAGMRGFSFNPQGSSPGGPPAPTVNANLANNTIDGSNGSAISISGQDGSEITLSITNNLLTNHEGWGISIFPSPGVTLNDSIDNNGYFNNAMGDVQAPLAPGLDALFADPRYVDQAGGDLHLRAGSPAIDRGAAIPLPLTDRDGNPRIQGAAVDLGAYEAAPVEFEIPVISPLGMLGLGALLAFAGLLTLRRRAT
ncbi:MAG: right-handed parallel beta-helix repeat-containing protein [Acidobacteriota bacterium]